MPESRSQTASGNQEQALRKQVEQWDFLTSAYRQFRKKYPDCDECALRDEAFVAVGQRIVSEMKLMRKLIRILRSFNADTFSEFLGMALIPDKCKAFGLLYFLAGDWQLNQVDSAGEVSSFRKVQTILRKALLADQPLIVDGYCALDQMPRSQEACNATHSLLVTGMGSVCNKVTHRCHDVIKVLNSSGAD